MRDERWELIRQILDLQTDLYRSLRPAREWLEVDLTMPQTKVLFLLYSDGVARMGQLASSLGVTLSTVTGIVDRLVEQDMVQRQEHPQDRRLVVCRLTSRGSETVERLHQAGRGRMADLLGGLSVDDLHKVVAGLAILSTAASESAEQPQGVASAPTSWRTRVSPAI
jgi:DNA-binding MarR family transcriptional regulator